MQGSASQDSLLDGDALTGWPRNRTGTGNRNRRERFSQELNAELEPPEPFFQEPKLEPEPSSLLTVLKHTKKNPPSLEEPPEPKTGTANRSIPKP